MWFHARASVGCSPTLPGTLSVYEYVLTVWPPRAEALESALNRPICIYEFAQFLARSLSDRANAASRVPFGRWRAAPRVRCSRPRCAAHVIVACFALILLYCILPLSSYSSTTALRPLAVRAAPAERSSMHEHNFSATATHHDELRPVAALQVWG